MAHCLGRYCTEKDPGKTCWCDCESCEIANETACRPVIGVVLNDKQKKAMQKLLNSISWKSGGRWDQWLRYDVGDEDADKIIQWCKDNGIDGWIPDR